MLKVDAIAFYMTTTVLIWGALGTASLAIHLIVEFVTSALGSKA